jgi:hypothetical protein
MLQLQASVAAGRTSAMHGSPVVATVWWQSALVGLLIVLTLSAVAALAGGAPSTTPSEGAERRGQDAYAKLPLSFVPNAGQTDESVRYYAQGAGFSFYFTPDKAVLALQKGDDAQALHLRFLGANPNAKLLATDRGTGRVNYLAGSEHHTNLPTYHQLVYRELWPGIDMAFRGQGGKLKYEFRLRPGADPSNIRLAYGGSDGLSLAAGGSLLIDTPLGVLRDSRPVSYQRIDGKRVPVESGYAVTGASYGFRVGGYDADRPLVIDPSLAYSTFLGGTSSDGGFEVAVDGQGNAYVAGFTFSSNFPTTSGAFDTSFNAGTSDAFVTKLNPAGSALVYSTYLGGSNIDSGRGIAVDSQGNAYVSGNTGSADFPTTPGAHDTSLGGGQDAFVTKLNATGSALVYSTYLGGSSGDGSGDNMDLDGLGNAYVTGLTFSTNFPTTVGAHDTTHNGSVDAFVTKLNMTGSGLAYSTFLGGASSDQGLGVTVDGLGNAYATGNTGSSGFPTTVGAFDNTLGGSQDAFVTKLNSLGSNLVYSTYLGGSASDSGTEIAVDGVAAAYATGFTASADFPTTSGAFDTTSNGADDAFVTKLNTSGSTLDYSTYLGGSSGDFGLGIVVDSQSAAYVTGTTTSTNFPMTSDAFDSTHNGGDDAFVTKVNTAGSGLTSSTYLGGSGGDQGHGVAVDSQGSAYVTGSTFSSNFPTTAGAFDTSLNGGSGDAFVTKLSFGPGAPATLTLAPKADTNDVDTEHCVTATVEDAAGNPTPDIVVRFSVMGAVNTSGSETTNASGQATFCYQGPALPGADAIEAYADNDNDNTQDAGEPFDTASKVWTLPTSTPMCEAKITQGGWIIANNGDRGSFGGNAKADQNGDPSGNENYQDHGPAQPMHVKSIEITAITCNPERTRASIFGRATIDGTGSHVFRIDVQDLAEPGKGVDTYRIQLDTGYDSGEHTLRGGNVQIHQQ